MTATLERCPSCGVNAVEHYPHVWYCRGCGDHGDKRKQKRTPLTVTKRQRWQSFTINNQDEYARVQVRAMQPYLNDATDRIDVAPHDAFGGFAGTITTLRRNQ